MGPWWRSGSPAVSYRLIHYIEEYANREFIAELADYGIQYQEALGRIRDDGAESIGQQAAAALIMRCERHPRAAGKHWVNMMDAMIDARASTTHRRN